jgi:hypothetical protein
MAQSNRGGCASDHGVKFILAQDDRRFSERLSDCSQSQAGEQQIPFGKDRKKPGYGYVVTNREQQIPFGKDRKKTNPGYGYVVTNREQQIPFREDRKKHKPRLWIRRKARTADSLSGKTEKKHRRTSGFVEAKNGPADFPAGPSWQSGGGKAIGGSGRRRAGCSRWSLRRGGRTCRDRWSTYGRPHPSN